MADNQYYLNPLWRAYNKNKDSLSLRIFNGKMQWSVWNGGKRPAMSFTLSAGAVELQISILKALLNEIGAFKEALKQVKWDNAERKFNTIAQMLFVRNDKGEVSIEITGSGIDQRIVFEVRPPNTFNVGGDGLTSTQKANLEIKSLIEILEQTPMLIALASFNNPPQAPNRPGSDDRRSSKDDSSGGDDNAVF